MKKIYYVHYTAGDKSDSHTKQLIDELGLDYKVMELLSLKTVSTNKCDLIVADHPPLKDNHYSEIEAFAKTHPKTPIIVTRNKDFPEKLTHLSKRFSNVYFIKKLSLVKGGIEKILC